MIKSPAPKRLPWDWPSAILVFLLVQVAAARLVITDWAPYLFFTQTLGAFSVALGLALGTSSFRRGTVRWLAILYSLVILPWQMTTAVDAEADFGERLAIVGGRMWFSLGQFFARKAVEDSLFFVAFVSLAFWIVGLTAGYALARHNNTLGVLIPAGVAILLVQIYDDFVSSRIWALAVYVFLALVYLGRSYLRQNREHWDDQHVFVTSESTQNISRSLMLVAAVTVFLAWSLPLSLASLKDVAQTWDRLSRPIRERLNNAVTSLESPYRSGTGGDFYGENLLLGRTASVGDIPIFNVKVNPTPEDAPPRYYWRGRVYDTYIGGQWTNQALISSDFAPEENEVTLPLDQGTHLEARFTFTLLLAKQGLLYTPSDPFWVNRPGRILASITPGQAQDISSWLAEPALSGGDKYQVRSWIANPNIEQLRAAGKNYPAWVRTRYLSVPDALRPELQKYALEALRTIQAPENPADIPSWISETSPYDQAQAVTTYLRNTIEYSTTLTSPPKGVDPLLWVLSDYKKGFCMYYASAEVLMLRTLGIPSRMAVGFAQGKLDPQTDTYTVLKGDAHAWPEVYFPGIGWVEFEPTGNQDPLVRPAAPSVTPTPSGAGVDGGLLNNQDTLDRESRLNDEGVTQIPPEQTSNSRGLLLGLGLVIVGVLIAANQRFGLVENLPTYISNSYTRNGLAIPPWVTRWERWMHLSSIERSFHAVNFSLRWLGKPQPMHITPSERAATLQALLPSAKSAIDTLLIEHQSALYTPRGGSSKSARRAAWLVVGHTFFARLRDSWDRFDSRFNRYG